MCLSMAWKKPQLLVLFGALVNTEHERFIGGNAKISETGSCYSYLRQTESSRRDSPARPTDIWGWRTLHCGPSRAPWSILRTMGPSCALWSIPCPVVHPVPRGPPRAPWSIPCTMVHSVHHGPSCAPWSILCTVEHSGPSRAPWSTPCPMVHPRAPWSTPCPVVHSVHHGPSCALRDV